MTRPLCAVDRSSKPLNQKLNLHLISENSPGLSSGYRRGNLQAKG
jgi:hypothetical protein